MHRFTLFLASLVFTFPFMIGCGEKKSEPVASGDALDEYLEENPEVMIDPLEEEERMAQDDAEEQ